MVAVGPTLDAKTTLSDSSGPGHSGLTVTKGTELWALAAALGWYLSAGRGCELVFSTAGPDTVRFSVQLLPKT